MKRRILVVTTLVLAFSLPQLARSKGPTKLIVVDGASLPSTVEISDPGIVGTFNIWNGPGVRVNGQPAYLNPENLSRSVIDWSKDQVTRRPEDLDRYDVTLIVDGRTPANNGYEITYEFDPSMPGGYIYLPRTTNNTSMIWHGVEGNWFRSSESWERLVRPLIDASRDSD